MHLKKILIDNLNKVNELKRLLNQINQFINAQQQQLPQQQPSMSIRYAMPTYRHECFTNITEQLAFTEYSSFTSAGWQPQQTSMPRHIYQNHVPRSHPYLNKRLLVSSRTPTIRYATSTLYRHECFTNITEQLAFTEYSSLSINKRSY
ncbi:hypothetical protein RhiirC2_782102 [Rhizophagus irregularis]|uniref:Uncharacterized protein n=1 Tax=Rhizophagus irregularis TaxID=588596 RepID=A0A2N1N3W3_9GLOM|nr:hypothetical protein RhiirC2_782102 [Rhizophagus irregularis]